MLITRHGEIASGLKPYLALFFMYGLKPVPFKDDDLLPTRTSYVTNDAATFRDGIVSQRWKSEIAWGSKRKSPTALRFGRNDKF